MDPPFEHVAERRIDRALPVHAALARESLRLDLDREVALAAAVVAGMAMMVRAVVDHGEPGGSKGGAKPLLYFAGDRAG